MTMGHHQQTATILAFPSRAQLSDKAAVFGARRGTQAGGEAKALRAASPAFTDSWYHQAAIEEATPARKP